MKIIYRSTCCEDHVSCATPRAEPIVAFRYNVLTEDMGRQPIHDDATKYLSND